MSESAEARFVAGYIRKEKKERLLHELTNPKKRYRGLDRFCHHAGELVDPARVALQGDDLNRQPAFQRFLAAHPGDCALLSPDPWLDGQPSPCRKPRPWPSPPPMLPFCWATAFPSSPARLKKAVGSTTCSYCKICCWKTEI